jgi:hypothetical protein
MAITLKRGHGNFYAATTIAIVNGCKTPLWEAPWLEGERQRALRRLLYIKEEIMEGQPNDEGKWLGEQNQLGRIRNLVAPHAIC